MHYSQADERLAGARDAGEQDQMARARARGLVHNLGDLLHRRISCSPRPVDWPDIAPVKELPGRSDQGGQWAVGVCSQKLIGRNTALGPCLR